MNKELDITRLLVLFVVSVGIFAFLRTFVIDLIQVGTGSMHPTIVVGDKYLVEKVSFRFRKPMARDIVYLVSPVHKHVRLVKRVIATEGDVLQIRDKKVYINGNHQIENYVYHSRENDILVGDNIGPLTVPAGKVFLMGDNRDESEDSRDWKDAVTGKDHYFVPVKKIKGRLF